MYDDEANFRTDRRNTGDSTSGSRKYRLEVMCRVEVCHRGYHSVFGQSVVSDVVYLRGTSVVKEIYFLR